MKGKRILALLMGLTMTLTATACGNSDVTEESKSDNQVASTQNSTTSTQQSGEVKEEDLYYNTEGYPICDEAITLTMACIDHSGVLTAGDNKRVQTDEYASRLGIQLDVIPYTSEAYSTQLSLMLADDDLPDIITGSGFSGAEVADYGEQGYFLDLSQYLHLMPNLQAIFEQFPTYKTLNTTESGAIYGLTALADTSAPEARCFFTKSWMDNLGLERPTTVDELYDVLKAFKEQDANGNGDPNDEIPMQYTLCRNYVDEYLFAAFGMNPQTNEVPVDVDENGEVRLTFMSENYKAYLQYLNKLYSEELIDQECFSATTDIVQQKYKDNLIGFGGESAPYITYGVSSDMACELGIIAYPMTSDYNDQAFMQMGSVSTDSNKILVSADCEYPEAVCRFIDYLFTPEGALSTAYGYEGISFEYVELEGLGYTIKYAMPEGYEGSTQDFKAKECVLNGVLDVGNVYAVPGGKISTYCVLMQNIVPKYYAGEIDEATNEEYKKTYGWNYMRAELITMSGAEKVYEYPTLVYTEEEAKIRDQVKSAISAYLTDAKAQFIIGGLDFEGDWDDYIKELNAMGAQELLAVEQAAYARIQ